MTVSVSRCFLFALAAQAMGLAACAPEPPKHQAFAPEIVPYDAEPISVTADRIVVTVESRSYAAGAPSEVEFLVSPEQIARAWPQRRLKATGGDAIVRYIVRNVGVTSSKTPVGEEVTAAIDIRMIVDDSSSPHRVETSAQVESTTRFADGASAMERWQALQFVSRDLATKLDRKLSEAVWRDFAGHVVPSITGLASVAPVQEPLIPAPTTQPDPLPLYATSAPEVTVPAYIEAETLSRPEPVTTAVGPAPSFVVLQPAAQPAALPAAPPEPVQVLAISPGPVASPAYPVAKAANPVSEAETHSSGHEVPTAVRQPERAGQKADSPSLFGGGDMTEGAFLPGSSKFPALPE